ncbi:MAG: hypothetical protein R3339_02585, partial [Thermodesulfobacteriota bacterium]|nr:hypothetical protein [Thermodesulfobacteriota bacterium]
SHETFLLQKSLYEVSIVKPRDAQLYTSVCPSKAINHSFSSKMFHKKMPPSREHLPADAEKAPPCKRE